MGLAYGARSIGCSGRAWATSVARGASDLFYHRRRVMWLFQSALLRPLESWSTGRSRPRAPHPQRPSPRRGGDGGPTLVARRSAPAGAHCARDRPDRRRACAALPAMRARTVPGRVAPAAPHTRRSSPTVMTSPGVRLLSTSRRHRRSPRCLSGAARRRADGASLPPTTELARSARRVATAASQPPLHGRD